MQTTDDFDEHYFYICSLALLMILSSWYNDRNETTYVNMLMDLIRRAIPRDLNNIRVIIDMYVKVTQ